MSRRGQVTIFIIIGIVIVVGVLIYLLFRQGVIPDLTGSDETESPSGFLDICLEEKVNDAILKVSSQGGNTNPKSYKTFKFTEEGYYSDISYLCYTPTFYEPCVNQQPRLLNHVQEEIKTYLEEDVEFCFTELIKNYRNLGYVVEVREKTNAFDVILAPNRVQLNINHEITLTKNEKTTTQKDFKTITSSKLYELSDLAQEILNQEAQFCFFNYIGYMSSYPEFDIDKHQTSDSTTIYTLKHNKDINKFRFAIRGCVLS